MDRIPPEDLIIGGIYQVVGRNITIGLWTGDSWIGIREKFGYNFLDDCEIPERTCYATSFVDMLPNDIEMKIYLPDECSVCYNTALVAVPVDFDVARDLEGIHRWQHSDGRRRDHEAKPQKRQYQPLFRYLNELDQRINEHGRAQTAE